MIQASDLVFRYGEELVINGVSLDVRPGECLAVMGANGSGKTTLLRLLAGLREPDAGTVDPDGVVGFAPEDPRAGLFASTVEEEVSFFPRNQGLAVEAAADRAMRRMEVHHLRDRNPLALSFGEQRRVSIASVLAGDPTVVALDEPTAGLGVASERRLGELVAELESTVVLSTHSSEFAYRYADRVAVLDDGRVRSVGSAQETLSRLDLLEAVGIRPPGIVWWAQANGLEEPPDSLEEAVADARGRQ